jgi:citrate lyase subunit beta/citryl-CoA lyase
VSLPLRSLLFAPGDDEHKLRKALGAGADGVVFDLEDAVAIPAKAQARAVTRAFLSETRGASARLVRVNAHGSAWFEDDVALLAAADADAIVLPKATPQAAAVLAAASQLPVIAIVETAIGLRQAFETASGANVIALLLGAVDLGAQLGLQTRDDGLEIHYARSKLVVDSAAAGIRAPIDVVHTAIADLEGLARAAALARSLGLRGKAAIHPSQVAAINEAFTPSAQELEWARRVVAAAAQAASEGRGAINLDGSMVDAAVVAVAERIVGESEGGDQ